MSHGAHVHQRHGEKDSSGDEGQGVHDCDPSRVVQFQAIVQRLAPERYCNCALKCQILPGLPSQQVIGR